MNTAMLEDKVSNALDWLRNAKDKLHSFAIGEEPPNRERLRVGLALAGGFARGIAHVGVLRALTKAGIPIDCVAGTSVGALIGACYCAGVPLDDMQRIASGTTFADFGRWTPSWLGLATNQRMEKYFTRFTYVKNSLRHSRHGHQRGYLRVLHSRTASPSATRLLLVPRAFRAHPI